jgi:uncharacterized protein (DUF1786 family)
MQILTVDIGTGTQDIFLYDSRSDLENGYKLVVPAPTMIVHRLIKEATRRGQAVLLSGVTMGGGPSQWAAEAHIRAGFPVYATPDAARTFNDELEAVEGLGIRVVSEDEAAALPESVLRLELRDLDLAAIRRALGEFGVGLDELAAVAAAVFDHGNSPPGYSDRQFRFDYLEARLDQSLQNTGSPRDPFPARRRLASFAFHSDNLPVSMTRLQAVAISAMRTGLEDVPLVVMDTAPAAVLGATYDPKVAAHWEELGQVLVANVGNFHTLAFRLGLEEIEGIFEHHTGLLDLAGLEELLFKLAEGSLRHADVFGQHGHGALLRSRQPMLLGRGEFDLAVTGPRRSLFSSGTGRLRPCFAAPFGDMMMAGCFGLLSAAAELLPQHGEEIQASLKGRAGQAPWE